MFGIFQNKEKEEKLEQDIYQLKDFISKQIEYYKHLENIIEIQKKQLEDKKMVDMTIDELEFFNTEVSRLRIENEKLNEEVKLLKINKTKLNKKLNYHVKKIK